MTIKIDILNLNFEKSVWKSHILIIMGPSCIGKTILAKEMCKLDVNLEILPTYTTRKKRSKNDNNKIFITLSEFKTYEKQGDFFYKNIKKDVSYGYRKSDLKSILDKRRTVILLFHSNGAIALKREVTNIPTIFFVAPIDLLENCMQKRYKSNQSFTSQIQQVLKRNNEFFDFICKIEKNCIKLRNDKFEPPIPKKVIFLAMKFYKTACK